MKQPMLKPCPFCLAEQTPLKDEIGRDYAVQRHAPECPLVNGSQFIFDFSAWNRRPRRKA